MDRANGRYDGGHKMTFPTLNPFSRRHVESDCASRIARAIMARRRVLVVDDCEMALDLARVALKRVGVDVQVAHSLNAAKAILSAMGPFAALFLDVRLPGEDSLEFYREVTQRWPEVEVVFWTSYPIEIVRDHIERIGPARIFSKPSMDNPAFMQRLTSQLGLKCLDAVGAAAALAAAGAAQSPAP